KFKRLHLEGALRRPDVVAEGLVWILACLSQCEVMGEGEERVSLSVLRIPFEGEGDALVNCRPFLFWNHFLECALDSFMNKGKGGRRRPFDQAVLRCFPQPPFHILWVGARCGAQLTD